MEYQKDGEQTWTACEGNEVTGLSAGKYNVRYKADGLKLASSEIPVTVNAVPGENNKDKNPSTKPDVSGGGSSNNGDGSSVGGNNNSGGSSSSRPAKIITPVVITARPVAAMVQQVAVDSQEELHLVVDLPAAASVVVLLPL